MPVKKSAIKALRQNKKRATRNKNVKDNIAFLIRKANKLILGKNKVQAKEFVDKALKVLDKAAQKGIIKKNTCDRTKSRLMKRFNFLK